MKIHIVKQGDTLCALARKYGVTSEELIAMNSQLTNPDRLDVGMKIKIPLKRMPSVNHEIVHKHMVVEGDTLWKLSKARGISLQSLVDANPQLKNPNVLVPGQVVNIPEIHGITNMPIANQQASAKANLAKLEEEAKLPKAEKNNLKIEVKQPEAENLQPFQQPIKLKIGGIESWKETDLLYKLEKVEGTSPPPTQSIQEDQQAYTSQLIYHQPVTDQPTTNQLNMIYPNLNQPYPSSASAYPPNFEAPIHQLTHCSFPAAPIFCDPGFPAMASAIYLPAPSVFSGVSPGVPAFVPATPIIPMAPLYEHSNPSYYDPMLYGNIPDMPNAFCNNTQSLHTCKDGYNDSKDNKDDKDSKGNRNSKNNKDSKNNKNKKKITDENEDRETVKKEGKILSSPHSDSTESVIKNMKINGLKRNKKKSLYKKKAKKCVKVSLASRPWLNKY